VLVDSPHEKAWRESLRELMESGWRDIRDRATWSPEAFTSQVYQEHISGKPRASGARAALDYFQVPDAGNRVAEYARHKQEMVLRLIEAGDFTAYPDARRTAGDAEGVMPGRLHLAWPPRAVSMPPQPGPQPVTPTLHPAQP
jgi:beta-phosphoglucomutase